MTIFALAGLLVGLLCTSLAVVSIFSRHTKIYILLFLFNVAVAIWGFGCFSAGVVNRESEALLSWKIAHIGGIFLSVIFYHLVCVFCEVGRRTILIFGYVQAVVCICLIFILNNIITQTRYVYGIYYNDATPLYAIPVTGYLIFVLASFVELFLCLEKAAGEKKMQTLRIICGFLFGFVGGTSTLLPMYRIDFLYPAGNFGICIYALIVAYALFRYRLFDLGAIAEAFQKEKLATLGLLTASINHEIRSPLYAVKGLLETYIENEKEGLPRKTPLETSEKALKQVQRALEVIQKLNRFAKPTVEDSNQIVSISEALQTVSDLISYEFSLEKIQIKNLLPNNLPKIQADQRQLEEILFNLIVNACHAMSGGGELVIAAEIKEEKVIVIISDTGTGISKDQIHHLFEPFHTTKGDKGTGLGLYITKQMVERNGGKISVQSKPGQGTTFLLEFKKYEPV